MNSTQMKQLADGLSVLAPKPGDTVIFKTEDELTPQEFHRTGQQIGEALPTSSRVSWLLVNSSYGLNLVSEYKWVKRAAHIWALAKDEESENETGIASVEIEKGKPPFILSMERPLMKSEINALLLLVAQVNETLRP